MTKISGFLVFLILTTGATGKAEALRCANEAVAAATAKNFAQTHAGSNSCGAKLLNAGPFLETYLVCITDESDGSEWVVSMVPQKEDKNAKITRSCVVEFAENSVDDGNPNFSEENDPKLLKVQSCDREEGSKMKCTPAEAAPAQVAAPATSSAPAAKTN